MNKILNLAHTQLETYLTKLSGRVWISKTKERVPSCINCKQSSIKTYCPLNLHLQAG